MSWRVKQGGRFENDLEGSNAARKADKGAVKKAKASRIAKPSQHQMISETQSELFKHSHMIHSLEKRMIIAEKAVSKSEKN